jgi:hypothetical protein
MARGDEEESCKQRSVTTPLSVSSTASMDEDLTTLDFDVVLKRVGERGRYQMLIYYLLCIPATLPAAWLAFIQVFVSASPEHWCLVPEAGNLTIGHRKNVTVPRETRQGQVIYEKCSMYDVNYTEFVRSGMWPSDANPSWPKKPCSNGWEFDKSEYDRTLVTDVSTIYHIIVS